MIRWGKPFDPWFPSRCLKPTDCFSTGRGVVCRPIHQTYPPPGSKLLKILGLTMCLEGEWGLFGPLMPLLPSVGSRQKESNSHGDGGIPSTRTVRKTWVVTLRSMDILKGNKKPVQVNLVQPGGNVFGPDDSDIGQDL